MDDFVKTLNFVLYIWVLLVFPRKKAHVGVRNLATTDVPLGFTNIL